MYIARIVDLVLPSTLEFFLSRESAMADISLFTLWIFSGEVEMAYSAVGRYLLMTLGYLLFGYEGMLAGALISFITSSMRLVPVVLLWLCVVSK